VVAKQKVGVLLLLVVSCLAGCENPSDPCNGENVIRSEVTGEIRAVCRAYPD